MSVFSLVLLSGCFGLPLPLGHQRSQDLCGSAGGSAGAVAGGRGHTEAAQTGE